MATLAIGDIHGYVLDEQGRFKGQYVKLANKTYDGSGRYFGDGEQLLRLLDQA